MNKVFIVANKQGQGGGLIRKKAKKIKKAKKGQNRKSDFEMNFYLQRNIYIPNFRKFY